MTRQASARNTGILPQKHNPLNRFKLSPENLISVATPVELEFEDLPETVFTALTEKVKSILAANRPAMTPV
ncbi:hypothetical protein ECZU31_18140 [Escherichia coli]|nr:hypothetical protein ECZU31_18140 [Escherichia coli]